MNRIGHYTPLAYTWQGVALRDSDSASVVVTT